MCACHMHMYLPHVCLCQVREAMSTLDLDVEVYPCPKDGTTWRPKAIELGGKKQFPYLVDPNTGMVRGGT